MEAQQQEPVDRSRVLDQLVRADVFEQTIHSRYIGTKRYSLEGNTALIPLLDEILNSASEQRRRAGGAGHEPSRTPERHHQYREPSGGGDFCRLRRCRSAQRAGRRRREVSHRRDRNVHRRQRQARCASTWCRIPATWKRSIRWRWAARAPSRRASGATASSRSLPILMHGDAAFAGQGITAETLEPRQPARLHRRRNGTHHRQQSASASPPIRAKPIPAASRPTWPSACRFPSST